MSVSPSSDRAVAESPALGDGPRFSQKPGGDAPVGGEIGVNDLDRDESLQGQVFGKVDHPHPAPPELAINPVLTPQRRLQRRGKSGVHSRPNRGLISSKIH